MKQQTVRLCVHRGKCALFPRPQRFAVAASWLLALVEPASDEEKNKDSTNKSMSGRTRQGGVIIASISGRVVEGLDSYQAG